MKKKWLASLAAMVLAMAALAAQSKYPLYLIMDGTTVTGYTGKIPANLVIPEGVTAIGDYAFYECTSLASVKIPASVTYIGALSFFGCTSLASIEIPEGVTEIGDSAFRGCTLLASAKIPASVTHIGAYAFLGCTLKAIQFGGTRAQWKALGDSNDIKVSVVRCSDGRIGIEEVPEYLQIKGTTVTGYTGTLPANLVIPDGVTAIGERAFSYCASLTSVTIPDSVTAIGRSAFGGCTSLKEIQFKGTTAQWQAIQGGIQVTLVRCSDGHIGIEEVPEYLKIGGTTVTGYTGTLPANLVIPDGVTEIGGYVFRGCTSLASVSIPDTVTAISENAFYGCTSLKEVQFGGTTAQWKAIQGSNNVNASTIRCSDGYIGVKEVPEYLKMDGSTVTGYTGTLPANLVIPDGVTEIGGYVFRGCTSLANVSIPDTVTAISENAFYGCTSLKEVQFGGTAAQWKALKGSNGVKVPYILCSDGYIGIKDLPAYLKMDGTKVTGYTGKVPANLVIPDGVTAIGRYAFKGCSDIESVTIPSSVADASWAFVDCTYLERVTIKNGVAKISDSMFSDCTSLKSVTISESVTAIGEGAFYKCILLKNVSIPGSVTAIGKSAFAGCKSLASVIIPGSVTAIGESAFHGCTSLKSVTIPESVTAIGESAFSGCTLLASVTIGDGVTAISKNAFYGCTSLAGVTIPGSVTEIGYGAFQNCTSLAGVTIPDSVTAIGNSTFQNCTSLKSVTILGSVKTIGLDVFKNCTSLANMVIPRGVTAISAAFRGCTSLANVSIPRSVTKIDGYVFANCNPNLKIQYDGTKAQWNNVNIEEGYMFKAIIQCSDGDIVVK